MALFQLQGPEVQKVSRKEAETALRSRDDIPEGAEVAVTEIDGHWVAAIHVAEFPPAGGGDDDGGEAAPPKPEKSEHSEPDGDEGGSDDDGGPPSDDGGPPKEHGEHGDKGGEHEVLALLNVLFEALGIPLPGADAGSPIPGEEGPPAGPGGLGGPPPGAGGPPPGAGGPPPHGGHPGGGPAEQKIQHERALKPGEVPPGSTPVGAPAFASVRTKDGQPHPWGNVLGKKATFETRPERIPESHTVEAVHRELDYLADGTGYKVKQVNITTDPSGHKIARALISRR